jgi:hypothetical protein
VYILRIREHTAIINFLEDIIHERKQSLEISLTESMVNLRIKVVNLKHIVMFHYLDVFKSERKNITISHSQIYL